MASQERQTRPSSARARGRRGALIAYYALVAVIGVVAAVQVTRQVFFGPPPLPVPYATCREGLRSLLGAVSRAREAAAGTDGEDAALARFRSALEPEWTRRDGVAAKCRGSTDDAGTLDAIERLRYAEEHAVRREAGELAPLRRKVQAILQSELDRAPREGAALEPPRSEPRAGRARDEPR